MSLKAFHIFFIFMAILISLGFAAWVFTFMPATQASAGAQLMGTLSALIGVGLIPYSVFFIRKARHIIV